LTALAAPFGVAHLRAWNTRMAPPKPPPKAAADPRKWLPQLLLPMKLLAALLFVIAAVLAIGLGMNLMRARATLGWKTAEATVGRFAVVASERGRGYARVEVSYRYRLYDVDYAGSRLGYGDDGERERPAAEALALKLKPGETFDVFYDPRDPANAVLFPGPRAGHYVAFSVPGVLIVAGVVVLFARSRVRRWLREHPAEPEPAKKPAAKW